MRLSTVVATVIAQSSLALAQTSSWDTWSPEPVTTTITKVLLHANEMTTTTAYSSTTASSSMIANVTTNATTSAYAKPASATLTPLVSSTTAAIATFSSGAATVQELDVAIAALAGIGVVAYGLF